MKLYRLTLTRYADTAFSGEGARRVGSRWTPPGYPAVYTSSSIALTVLETLVHTDSSVMPTHQVISVAVPSKLAITAIELNQLPEEWRATPSPETLQTIGREWLDSANTVILQVPSVIVSLESNYVLNPLHKDFKKLIISPPKSFIIDTRLLRS